MLVGFAVQTKLLVERHIDHFDLHAAAFVLPVAHDELFEHQTNVSLVSITTTPRMLLPLLLLLPPRILSRNRCMHVLTGHNLRRCSQRFSSCRLRSLLYRNTCPHPNVHRNEPSSSRLSFTAVTALSALLGGECFNRAAAAMAAVVVTGFCDAELGQALMCGLFVVLGLLLLAAATLELGLVIGL